MASNSSKNSDYGITWGPGSSSSSKSSSSSSGSKSKSKSSSGSSSSSGGGGSSPGYAYVDKYGFSHVVKDYDTAKDYSAGGDVYDYSGNHGGGYAYDDNNSRVPLDLPGSVPYGNDVANKVGYNYVPKADSLGSIFTGKLGGIASAPSMANLPTFDQSNNLPNVAINASMAPLASLAPIGNTATATKKEPWEISLEGYKTNHGAGYQEIQRAQQVYNQKMAAGDYTGAQAAHHWANQIRDAMGISAQFERATGAPLSSNDANLYLQTQDYLNLANENKEDVYNTTNQYLQAYLDKQKEFADYPKYTSPEREEFRFTTSPPSITSSGDDIHIPTLAAKQQWEAEQDAIQNQAYQDYSTDYARNQNVYNTQTEWLKLAMAEQQRQEEIAREAARWQSEQALAVEQEQYNRAWEMFNAGVATDEIYNTLGIPAGSKPFDQMMSEWEMKMAEKEYSLAASKAASGSSGGGSSYKLSQQIDDAIALYKATGTVSPILKQYYPDLQDQGSSEATKAFTARVLKYKEADNAREFIRANAITANLDGVDMNQVYKTAKQHYGKAWDKNY